jgi:hypothetical protein
MIDYMMAMALIQCGDAGRSEARRREWTLRNSGETRPPRVTRRFPWWSTPLTPGAVPVGRGPLRH